jgi:large subunit ribosomal protein L16
MNVQISKYRKVHKPRLSVLLKEQKRVLPLYGTFSLRALQSGRLSFNVLNSVRKTLKKVLKKNGNIWQTTFADLPVTSKPAEVRMGKGKGAFSHNVALVLPGTVLFELGGVALTNKLAFQAFTQASYKFGILTELIRRTV